MSQRYRDVLDYEVGARIVVDFTTRRREVVDYAVILTVDDGNGEAAVRVYDGAHGVNEMHAMAQSAGRHPQRPSMPVLLAKGCELRSQQFALATRR